MANKKFEFKKFSRYFVAALFIFVTGPPGVTFLGFGECAKQELWMYMKGGSVLYFDTKSSISNLSSIAELLPIVKLCAVGRWHLFQEENFRILTLRAGGITAAKECNLVSNPTLKIKSLRRVAGPDTNTSTIVLFPGALCTGLATQITQNGLTNIGIGNATSITDLVITGKSNWTVFEMLNLRGKSHCYQSVHLFSFYNSVKTLLRSVGSVFKGCDSKEIEMYRKEYKLTI